MTERKIVKESLLEPVSDFPKPSDSKAQRISFAKWKLDREYWLVDIQHEEIHESMIAQTRVHMVEIMKHLPHHAIKYTLTRDAKGTYHEEFTFSRSYYSHS